VKSRSVVCNMPPCSVVRAAQMRVRDQGAARLTFDIMRRNKLQGWSPAERKRTFGWSNHWWPF